MTRYINADNAIAAIYHRLYVSVYDAQMVIENIPTADVRENVHGEWLYEQLIPNTIEGKMYGECSVCHKVRIVDNFCPNCGAVMDMKKELE